MKIQLLLKFVFCFAFLFSAVLRGEAAIVCPPLNTISPCKCEEYSGKPGTIQLDCYNQNVNDSMANQILDFFLTTPGVSPIGYLTLGLNRLTFVPSQIRFFSQLVEIHLFGNLITSIESGAFDFTNVANFIPVLELYTNKLTTIAPGAFKGCFIIILEYMQPINVYHNFIGNVYGNGTKINLNFNLQLARFESTVFQSMLEKIAPLGGYPNAWIEIDYSKSINNYFF
jgi:hypothetical protein